MTKSIKKAVTKRPKKPKELRRRVAGIQVFGGMRSPTTAYVLYEIQWDDGAITHERGRSIHGTAYQLNDPAYTPELEPVLAAMQPLFNAVEYACVKRDGFEKTLYR